MEWSSEELIVVIQVKVLETFLQSLQLSQIYLISQYTYKYDKHNKILYSRNLTIQKCGKERFYHESVTFLKWAMSASDNITSDYNCPG